MRHRTVTFRGFYRSVKSANLIMKGYEVYYNFITRHQTINCCPYELATDLQLKSNNKWLERIQLSKKTYRWLKRRRIDYKTLWLFTCMLSISTIFGV